MVGCFPVVQMTTRGNRYLKINLNALFPSVTLYERDFMENGPQEIRDLWGNTKLDEFFA